MVENFHDAELIAILSRCLLIFGIAGLIVPIFNRIHVSPVLGFLICGIMIGPYALGLLADDLGPFHNILIVEEKTIKLLGELGVIGLLFMIGLELSFEKLREMKRYIFGLGSLQIGITTALITLIALTFGNSLETSIVIGMGFSLSSTAIIMQLLKEHHLTRRSLGRTSFSILLMQDLAIVPILILIGVFSGAQGDSGSFYLLGQAVILAIVCVIAIYVVGKKVVQPVLHSIAGTNKDEWLAAFTLFILCGITLLTLKSGLSVALGAFLSGLLIAETEFRDKIEKILYPLKSILLGAFFISIGMMVNVVEILNNPLWLCLSVVGIFILKGIVIYPLCRIFGIKSGYAKEIAVILSQPGEFTLMVISLSLSVGLLSPENAQFFLLVTVIGMLLTPVFFRFLPTVRTHNA